MFTNIKLATMTLCVCLTSVMCSPLSMFVTEKNRTVFLDQGWSQKERQSYYWTTQGSALLSYDIFLHLEEAKGLKLFRSAENMIDYGLVPQDADLEYNPDGLPIGWTKTVVPEGQWKGEWAGITCAACHNAQLEYKGTRIRVDGGFNPHFDLFRFIRGIDDAVAATVADAEKFDRLAMKLCHSDPSCRKDLRGRLEADANRIHRIRSKYFLPPIEVGPGRMDALVLVHNQIAANELRVPENWMLPSAPVKWPFLWNAPQSAWIGWRGTQQFPLLRNAGESMALWVATDLTSDTPAAGLFDSTVNLQGQITIEKLLRKLAPPMWPEDILGKLNGEKAQKGAQLFMQHCAECHSQWPHRWSEPKKSGKRFIENALVFADVVGTDATQVENVRYGLNPIWRTGRISEFLPAPYKSAALAPSLILVGAAVQQVVNRALPKLGLSQAEIEDASGYRHESEPMPPNGLYKAAPREGTWAIAPYLHNGSVPNLYELLLPAKKRSQKFFIGREFDPVKVGVDTTGNSGKFLFDTTLLGNSNAGHSFEDGPRKDGVIGPLLSEDDRWALIEYLKSIPNQPAQVAPFGGPEHPIRAWEDKTFYHNRVAGGYQGGRASSGEKPQGPGSLGEVIHAGEAEQISAIVQHLIKRLSVQYPPGTQTVPRDAHPKTHGLVRAEFIVLGNLPDELRYGVFKEPRIFKALIRFSASGSMIRADTIPEARGMAIKLLDIGGDKAIPSQRDAKSQDFLMINFPVFPIRELKDYVQFFDAQSEGAAAEFWRSHPEEFKLNEAFSAQRLHNPLRGQYFSQTPYRLGPHAIKFSARPSFRTADPLPVNPGPEYLREALLRQVQTEDVYFDFMVQLQIDPRRMPVENPMVLWDEALSPFQRVAIIRIPKQDPKEFKDLELAEALSFSPWHALPDHRPLGSINRARRVVYDELSKYRHGRNSEPHKREPGSL